MPATTHDSSPTPSADGASILVCEDDPTLLAVITDLLAEEGYAVRGTSDPQHALVLAGELDRLDLLVTDVVMPTLLGTALAARIDRVRPGVPVLFISGYNEDPEAMWLREIRSSAFLEKPFEATELLDAVRTRLTGG
jgi:DNA-binding response OmpR family regulator